MLTRRMYAFDVHCNSYFPLFILLYGKHADGGTLRASRDVFMFRLR